MNFKVYSAIVLLAFLIGISIGIILMKWQQITLYKFITPEDQELLSWAFLKEGDYEKARSSALAALQRDASRYGCYIVLSRIEEASGRLDSALYYLKIAQVFCNNPIDKQTLLKDIDRLEKKIQKSGLGRKINN